MRRVVVPEKEIPAVKFQLVELQIAIAPHWFTSQQVRAIQEMFPRDFGNARCDIGASFFGRTIDIGNYKIVVNSLPDLQQQIFVDALGSLNVYSIMKPVGYDPSPCFGGTVDQLQLQTSRSYED
jgi:hypothetical protein